jgi:16S rRNA (cytosine967-C5)-methyltransferase
MAEQMKDEGTIVALDRRQARMARLVGHSRRMGFASIFPVVADALAPPLKESAHVVLVDAPCSGLGVLRRHPEGRWLKGPEIIDRHAKLQSSLLAALAPQVAQGGALVYSVCSFEPEETTKVVGRWLAEQTAWVPEDPRPYLPVSAHRWVTDDEAMCILPEAGGPDGFFAVRLRRKG